MSKKLLSVTVRGKQSEWIFNFQGDPRHLDDWRADGLEVYQIENTIPTWVADFGIVRPWCALQNFINFKWLKRK